MFFLVIVLFVFTRIPMVWLFAHVFCLFMQRRGLEQPPSLRTLRTELRPFVPFAAGLNLLLQLMLDQSLVEDMLSISTAILILVLWATSKDDDDRWKRRRKKLGDKVKSMGHRLVPVPA